MSVPLLICPAGNRVATGALDGQIMPRAAGRVGELAHTGDVFFATSAVSGLEIRPEKSGIAAGTKD